MIDASEAASELLRRRKARQHLFEYIQYTNPKYKPTSFSRAVCSALDQFLDDAMAGERPILILQAPPQHGKQIADDTPVLTTAGWSTHGALRPGDRVFSPSGWDVPVLAVSEKSASRCKVELTDGTVIYCHERHEWTVYSRDLKRNVTIETRDMLKLGRRSTRTDPLSSGEPGARGHRYHYLLPEVAPLTGVAVDLPVRPYTLGAWLGDGTRIAPRISGDPGDTPILEAIVADGYPIMSQWAHNQTGVLTTSFAKLWQALKLAGVTSTAVNWRPKRIPAQYLVAPIAERLELLAGLIDTDGYAYPKNGRVVFTTAETELADSVMTLLATFGWRASRVLEQPKISSSGIVGKKPYWVIGFNPTFAIPCRLDRKRIAVFAAQRRVAVKSITLGEWGKCGNCIQVGAPDGLYLVGENLTPTHNSEIVSRKLPAYLLGRYPDLHVAAASYSDPLANSMSQAVRRNLASPEHAKLFPNAEGRRRYDVDRNGEFTAPGGTGTYLGVGIGSGLTGRSVDCLVAGTPIETDRGPVRIEELKTLGSSCKVLSYRNGRLSYERIKAFASGPGFGIWRVATARGRIFEATAGHRVFTSRGYVRTDELAEGDVLLSAMRRGAHNLCSGVQKAESEVLFSGLRGESESCRKSMRRVWRSAPARFISKVLRKLPKKTARDIAPLTISRKARRLSYVSERVCFGTSRTRKIRGILLKDLRGAWPRETHVGARESEVEKRNDSASSTAAFGKIVSYHPTGRALAGRLCLRAVRKNRMSIGSASYRRKPDEQSIVEFSDIVRPMSQRCASADGWEVEADRVARIDRVREKATVFDIQVEKSHNFFANGILVHNCAIIDDPTKNAKEALSPTVKGAHWDWYQTVFKTRLSEDSAQIIMATSWAEDDLPGRIAALHRDDPRLRVLRFPAINAPGEAGYNPMLPEGALCPELHSIEQLLEFKREMSEYWWSAMYQQCAKPLGGNIFKDHGVRYYLPSDLPAKFDKVIASWDCTFKDTDGTDFVVGQVWGKLGARAYLLDQRRARMSFTETCREVVQLRNKWPQIREILIEDKANGPAVIDTLKHAVPGLIPIEPDGSKVARAHAITAFWEAGNVWLPDPTIAPWVKDLVGELTAFPASANDDQVDGLTQALRRLFPLRGGLKISAKVLALAGA